MIYDAHNQASYKLIRGHPVILSQDTSRPHGACTSVPSQTYTPHVDEKVKRMITSKGTCIMSLEVHNPLTSVRSYILYQKTSVIKYYDTM